MPTEVAGEMIAEKTGEPVSWPQKLTVMKYYERDLMPWDVDASTRALAELCLVMINSNEFLYVY